MNSQNSSSLFLHFHHLLQRQPFALLHSTSSPNVTRFHTNITLVIIIFHISNSMTFVYPCIPNNAIGNNLRRVGCRSRDVNSNYTIICCNGNLWITMYQKYSILSKTKSTKTYRCGNSVILGISLFCEMNFLIHFDKLYTVMVIFSTDDKSLNKNSTIPFTLFLPRRFPVDTDSTPVCSFIPFTVVESIEGTA